MKKYVLLIFVLLTISSSKIFAHFEFNLQPSFAFSLIMPSIDEYAYKPPLVKTAFPPFILGENKTIFGDSISGGALVQTGYAFDLKKGTGLTSISLLFDVGYYMQTLGAFQTNTIFTDTSAIGKEIFYFHTLNIGILPKFNMRGLHFLLV